MCTLQKYDSPEEAEMNRSNNTKDERSDREFCKKVCWKYGERGGVELELHVYFENKYLINVF